MRGKTPAPGKEWSKNRTEGPRVSQIYFSKTSGEQLTDINRDIDFVNDREFKEPNKILNGLLKERMTSGLSQPTKHKDVISEVDHETALQVA